MNEPSPSRRHRSRSPQVRANDKKGSVVRTVDWRQWAARRARRERVADSQGGSSRDLRFLRKIARNDLARVTGIRFGFLYLYRHPRLVLDWFLLSLIIYGVLWLTRRITGWESLPVGFGVAVFIAGGIYVSPKIYSARHEKNGDMR